jgi:hypothetical protein
MLEHFPPPSIRIGILPGNGKISIAPFAAWFPTDVARQLSCRLTLEITSTNM